MTVMLSIVLALAVFVALPFGLSLLLKDHIRSQAVLALIEGLIRLGLFIGYVYVISFMQDINRYSCIMVQNTRRSIAWKMVMI